MSEQNNKYNYDMSQLVGIKGPANKDEIMVSASDSMGLIKSSGMKLSDIVEKLKIGQLLYEGKYYLGPDDEVGIPGVRFMYKDNDCTVNITVDTQNLAGKIIIYILDDKTMNPYCCITGGGFVTDINFFGQRLIATSFSEMPNLWGQESYNGEKQAMGFLPTGEVAYVNSENDVFTDIMNDLKIILIDPMKLI